MLPDTTSSIFAITCAVLACAARAQDDAAVRGRALGFVVDQAGERVAGARVHLTSWPVPLRTHVGRLDHVEVVTDAQGLFQADLLRGRGYSAWAMWEGGDGAPRRSGIAEHVTPGPPRELVETEAQTLRQLRVEGAAAWQERGPLEVTVSTGADNPLLLPLPLDDDGVVALPPLPGDTAAFFVRSADGVLLGFVSDLGLVGSRRDVVVTLAPPAPLRIVVVDEQGAGIADAIVWQANVFNFGAGHRRVGPDRLGTTDARGVLTTALPRRPPIWGSRQPGGGHFVAVEAEGRARAYTEVDFDGTDEHRIVLPKAPKLTGRLLGEGAKPAGGLTLLPEAYAQVAGSDGSGGFGFVPQPLRVGGDGRFEFSGLHPRYGFRLLALLDPRRARDLGMAIDPEYSLAPVAWIAVGKAPFASPHDLGDLRFDRLPIARIVVRTADGAPASGALLKVTTQSLYNSPLDYVVDRVGRLQFPLPEGEISIGAYVVGGGVARADVNATEVDGAAPIEPIVLTLTEPVAVRGVVVDQRGKPIAGAVVRPWNRPEQSDLADLAFEAFRASVPTGPDGAFAVQVPLGGVQQAIRAYVRIGDRFVGTTLELSIGDSEMRDVRFEVDTGQ